jgi:ribokinase
MSGRVIVVGSVNIDLVARVPLLPHPGETVTGGSYERHHGGKGGNQAVAAARLRRPTLFIGAAGDDTFEVEARRALASERVDVSMLASLPKQATGMALILVDATGENEIAVVPGANWAIEAGYVRDKIARLGRLVGDVLLVCNELPLHVVREALVCARAAGATTILNPAPATGIDRSLFGLADIVTPNRNELGMLLATEAKRTGRRVDEGTDTASRARVLLELGPEGPGVRRAVIVTLGSDGAVVLERMSPNKPPVWAPVAPPPDSDGEPYDDADHAAAKHAAADHSPADHAAADAQPELTEEAQANTLAGATPPGADPGSATAASAGTVTIGSVESSRAVFAAAAIDEPEPAGATRVGEFRIWSVPADKVATVDSTGAGDAFCGALAAALAEGRSLAEAVQRAVAGGALATTHVGAREGMPTAGELEEFLAAR